MVGVMVGPRDLLMVGARTLMETASRSLRITARTILTPTKSIHMIITGMVHTTPAYLLPRPRRSIAVLSSTFEPRSLAASALLMLSVPRGLRELDIAETCSPTLNYYYCAKLCILIQGVDNPDQALIRPCTGMLI